MRDAGPPRPEPNTFLNPPLTIIASGLHGATEFPRAAMTTEQRQFFSACVAAALFLGAVLSSVDVQVHGRPFSHSQVALR